MSAAYMSPCDVELARDVGAGQPELTGSGDEVAERRGERIASRTGASAGPARLPS